jgi:hypothetical protein
MLKLFFFLNKKEKSFRFQISVFYQINLKKKLYKAGVFKIPKTVMILSGFSKLMAQHPK